MSQQAGSELSEGSTSLATDGVQESVNKHKMKERRQWRSSHRYVHEFKALLFSVLVVVLFLGAMVVVFAVDSVYNGVVQNRNAIQPRVWPEGMLPAVFVAPFAHADLKHLLLASSVGGSLVWALAREGSLHLGTSLWILAYFGWLLAVNCRRTKFMRILFPFVLACLYVTLLWVWFPKEEEAVWESLVFGFLAGLSLGMAVRSVEKPSPQERDYEERQRNKQNASDEEQVSLLDGRM